VTRTVTGLTRTSLSVAEKSQLAASAFALQGEHGVISALARDYGVSRESVYNAVSTADAVLAGYFGRAALGSQLDVTVDAAQVVRAVIAMRVVGANSIRAIETLIPIVYPGVRLSYGSIQAILKESEQRAAALNRKDELSVVKAGALDEMFSQGKPVLAGVDLDTGLLFALKLCEHRGGEDWATVLRDGQTQGLDLKVVVKDAGSGIAAGVSAVFPGAEQRDDCFHALYEVGKVRQRLERRAYALVGVEYDAAAACEREKNKLHSSRSNRAKKAQELRHARDRAAKAVQAADHFEMAARAAQEALEFADARTGEIRTPQQMKAQLEAAGQRMKAMDQKHCRRVGKYLINRAPGLALHMEQVGRQFRQINSIFGEQAVREATRAYRNACDVRDNKSPWAKTEQKVQLRSAIWKLESITPEAELVFASVDRIIQNRHRASSAIEGFNSALRPQLYVHKGVTQGFLELFRFYYNRRRRRWGRHKGTSPHSLANVSANAEDDWLTELGYAPGATALQ